MPLSEPAEADLAALARSAALIREWLGNGCTGEPPCPQIALMATLAEAVVRVRDGQWLRMPLHRPPPPVLNTRESETVWAALRNGQVVQAQCIYAYAGTGADPAVDSWRCTGRLTSYTVDRRIVLAWQPITPPDFILNP